MEGRQTHLIGIGCYVLAIERMLSSISTPSEIEAFKERATVLEKRLQSLLHSSSSSSCQVPIDTSHSFILFVKLFHTHLALNSPQFAPALMVLYLLCSLNMEL